MLFAGRKNLQICLKKTDFFFFFDDLYVNVGEE